MKHTKLTDRYVQSITAPADGRSEDWHRDTELTGFAVRVRESGKRVFYLEYKRAGRTRRLRIGSYPSITVTQARKLAKQATGQVAAGNDPAADKQNELKAPTVRELVVYFFEKEVDKKKPQTLKKYREQANRFILPHLGGLKVDAVRKRDVQAVMRAMVGTPIQANRVLALTRRLFNVAIAHEAVDRNPCAGVEKFREEGRTDYLDPDEVTRLWDVLAEEENQDGADFIRLLLLTGARSSEVRRARWDAFNLDAGIWMKPRTDTKTGTTERCRLGSDTIAVLSVLKERRATNSPFIFQSPTLERHQPRHDFAKPWIRVRKAAGVERIRLHDLRHTFASHLVSSGHTLPTVGALLGHKQAQTTMRYAHLMDGALQDALESVGKTVTGKERASKVVPFRRKTGTTDDC